MLSPSVSSGLKAIVQRSRTYPYAKSAQETPRSGSSAGFQNAHGHLPRFYGAKGPGNRCRCQRRNRTAVFLALGAEVFTVGPQLLCAATLAKRFGPRPSFTLVRARLAEQSACATPRPASSLLSSKSSEFVSRSRYSGRGLVMCWRMITTLERAMTPRPLSPPAASPDPTAQHKEYP